jgi:hypothetical protein
LASYIYGDVLSLVLTDKYEQDVDGEPSGYLVAAAVAPVLVDLLSGWIKEKIMGQLVLQ